MQVVKFPFKKMNESVRQFLDEVKEKNFVEMVIIGFDADGNIEFCGKNLSNAQSLWAIEKVKKTILE